MSETAEPLNSSQRSPTQNDFLHDVDYTEVLIAEQRESHLKQVNCEENIADYTFFLQNRSVTRFLKNSLVRKGHILCKGRKLLDGWAMEEMTGRQGNADVTVPYTSGS